MRRRPFPSGERHSTGRELRRRTSHGHGSTARHSQPGGFECTFEDQHTKSLQRWDLVELCALLWLCLSPRECPSPLVAFILIGNE